MSYIRSGTYRIRSYVHGYLNHHQLDDVPIAIDEYRRQITREKKFVRRKITNLLKYIDLLDHESKILDQWREDFMKKIADAQLHAKQSEELQQLIAIAKSNYRDELDQLRDD